MPGLVELVDAAYRACHVRVSPFADPEPGRGPKREYRISSDSEPVETRPAAKSREFRNLVGVSERCGITPLHYRGDHFGADPDGCEDSGLH